MSYTGQPGRQPPGDVVLASAQGAVAAPSPASSLGKGVSYAAWACLDPLVTRDECLLQDLDVSWYGLPNQYANPLGSDSGRGWILLSRRSLDAIDRNAPHDLVMSVTDAVTAQTWSITHRALHIVEATCLTPGAPGDQNSAYLVELADVRRLLRARPLFQGGDPAGDSAYNTRLTATNGAMLIAISDYNGDTNLPWTWSEILAQIWGAAAPYLGTYPGLPAGYVPDGTPENLCFAGWSCGEALAYVCDRAGLALAYNSTTGTFSLVRPGVSDPAYTAATARRAGQLIHDASPIVPVFGRIPATIYVLFPTLHDGAASTPPATGQVVVRGDVWYWVVTVPVSDVGTDPNHSVHLYDDLDAWFDFSAGASPPNNQAALSTRATARATDYLARLRAAPARLIYGAPLADPGLQPGSQVQEARIGDTGQGMLTEVIRRFDGWRDRPLEARRASDPWRAGVPLLGKKVLAVPPLSAWEDPCGINLRTRLLFSGAMLEGSPGQSPVGSGDALTATLTVSWDNKIYDTDGWVGSPLPVVFLNARVGGTPTLLHGQIAVTYAVGSPPNPVQMSLLISRGTGVEGQTDVFVTGSGTVAMQVSAVTFAVGGFQLLLFIPMGSWNPGITLFSTTGTLSDGRSFPTRFSATNFGPNQ